MKSGSPPWEDKPGQGKLPRRRVRWVWTGGLALAAGLAFFHAQIFTGVAAFMTIRDPLERADLILPLYHEAHTVPFAAAELYHRGYAKRLAVLRTEPTRLERLGLLPPPHQIWRRVLEAEGVPPEAIITVGSQIQNAGDLAEVLIPVVARRGNLRIIVLASAPLSRLSRTDLRHSFGGSPIEIRMHPVRPREFDERTWWRSRHGWVTYFDVYYLWLVRFLRE